MSRTVLQREHGSPAKAGAVVDRAGRMERPEVFGKLLGVNETGPVTAWNKV
jgi:hypothetical protein